MVATQSGRSPLVLAVIAAAVVAGVAVLVAYARLSRPATPVPSASVSASAAASARPARKRSVGLAPLPGPPEQRLAPNASVFAPANATDSRPVLVVLGTADAGACRHWRELSHAYGFVLCPRPAHADRLSEQRQALRASLAALRRRFGDYVSPGPVVLIGVGASAVAAVSLLREEPAYFARVALVDAGFDAWTSGLATIFAEHGGKRALFVCTEPACAKAARDAAFLTHRAGAMSLVSEPEAGAAPSRPDFAWLVDHDPAWKPPR
jgi:hypothetical protein